MNDDLYRGIEDLGPDLAAAFDVTTLDREFYENPYPVFHALRRHVPVHKMPSGAWFLTRHADLDFAYHDPVLFSSDKTVDFRKTMGETSLYEHHTTSLVFNDQPEHTRVRKRLAPAFTPQALRALESRVVEVVGASLDAVAEMGSFDLLHDYSMKLPIELIGDMLGVPQEDRPKLSPWAVAILGGLEADLTPEQRDAAARSVDDFKDYLRWLISERERNPLSDDSGEVLSKLVGPDENGESLTELELLHNCIFLLNAGHETTANTVTNGIDALLRFPDQLERLRADPDLVVPAIEELLRFESSVQQQPETNRRCRNRRRGDEEGRLHLALHRRRQSRPGAISRSRCAGYRARAQPAPRLWIRHSRLRRHVAWSNRRGLLCWALCSASRK